MTATCYTDQGGQPCGKRVAAQLIIVPPGGRVVDALGDGRIGVCMRHLLVIMYSNGVGSDELANVIDGLALRMAGQIADEMRQPGAAARAQPFPIVSPEGES
jgi:hypothetical protein